MCTYIAIVVLILSGADFWNMTQLKNTILWTFSVAILSMFHIPQIMENDDYFRNAIRDNFKLIAVFEFVVAFYTFPLLVELGRVGGVVAEPLPPQTRACAIDALGSSPDRFAREGLP